MGIGMEGAARRGSGWEGAALQPGMGGARRGGERRGDQDLRFFRFEDEGELYIRTGLGLMGRETFETGYFNRPVCDVELLSETVGK